MNDLSNISQAVRAPGPSLPAPDAPQPLQRVGALVEIPRLLREMGVEPDPLLAAVGLQPAALDDIDARIPFPLVCDLILKCAQATGRADFPLVAGACGRLHHLGVVGALLRSAPDFGAALLDFVANHPRYVRGASVYLIDWNEHEILAGHRVHHPGLRGSSAFSAAAIAFGRAVFAELCGAEPTRVLLSLPRPDDPAPYKRAFGRAKVVFEAQHFALVYPRPARMRAIPTADPDRRRETRKFIADLWNTLQPDTRDRVMRVLVPSVLSGTPSLKATAELLATHPRTLDRALQARGLSFRQAVNEARFEMASQLLRDTLMSVGGVAQVLGYSEVSAFTRFFTSMSGRSPSDWKRRELAGTGAPLALRRRGRA